jgi:hypothetical protein
MRWQAPHRGVGRLKDWFSLAYLHIRLSPPNGTVKFDGVATRQVGGSRLLWSSPEALENCIQNKLGEEPIGPKTRERFSTVGPVVKGGPRSVYAPR